MMNTRRSILTTGLILALVALMFPLPAHAFGEELASDFLGLFVSMLEAIHKILVQIVIWCGQIINWVVGWEINYGGAAVYNVWKIFRDICNGLFIVLFMLVAFGTIFNVVYKNPYYWTSALRNVILAALLINFSLPIGQVIVWAGNKATALVGGLMTGVNISETILVNGQALQVAVGNNGLSLVAAPLESVPDDKLDAAQLIAKKGYVGNPKIALENCLKFNQATPSECSARAARIQAAETATAVDKEIARLESSPSIRTRLTDAWNFWRNTAAGAVKGAVIGSVTGGPAGGITGLTKGAWSSAVLGDPPVEAGRPSPTEQALKILSLLINNFFFGVLALGFATAILFMLLRLPFTWFYLSMSALAFFSIGIPGRTDYKEWFGNMVGWSIFAPLYLFVIYVGMFVLNQQGALLAGLKDAGAFAGIFGIGLFYFLTGGIFVGGAGAAWKYAFTWSGTLKEYVGGFADTLGVGAESNFGMNTVAEKIGLTSSYEAVRARGQQFAGDMGSSIKGRAPSLFRSNEESVAYKKMKLGVRGADAEVDKLAQKRIGTQKDIIEAAAGKITDPKQKEAYLRSQLNSGNQDASLAAGEILLKQGKLTPDQHKILLDKYGKVSPIARKGFQQRITEQLQKGSAGAWDQYLDDTTKEFKFDKFAAAAESSGKPEDVRKFLDAAMRGEVGNKQSLTKAELVELTELMKGSPEDQRTFLEATSKNGRSKVASIELMADLGLITDRNGKRVSVADAIEDRADSLSDLDLLDTEQSFYSAGKTMPPVLKEKMRASIKKPEKFGRMIRNVSDPEQQLRILDEFADVKRASSAARRDLKEIEKKERKYAQGVKQLRKKAEKLKGAKKKRVEDWVENLEVKRSEMKEQMQKLRKDIT